MSFSLVLSVLGWTFVSAWVFIGGMLIRDSLDQARKIRFNNPFEDPLRGEKTAGS